MITDEIAAKAFDALGNPARLGVLRLLVKAGPDGLNVGELQEKLNIPASTLAHHLKALSHSGIIIQERNGREIINQADFNKLSAILLYLTEECCEGAINKCC